MNVPLTWLSDYVTLPKSTKELTDKLTMVGHMLDKITKKGDETVIDLELRGNRADMFGLIGVARDVSAILNTSLKLPEVATLPKKDSKNSLIVVEKVAEELVTRYMAVHLKVKIGPSPKWLVDRLAAYGTPSINNVVDATNYVMLETGIPMHAFDYHRLPAGKIVLRRGKKGEEFKTIQQGLTVKLTEQDLVVGDALTMIGGYNSKITNETFEILLEAAVYHPGSVRRSARRLKISTEAGMRLEKHLDPEAVEFALARAVHLISGEVIGAVSDYYPNPVKPKVIKFAEQEIFRLSGMEVKEWQKILVSLGFEIKGENVSVPTFRTDIEGLADLVEEIVRIHGYDKIPEIPLSGATPIPMTYPTYALSEKVRDIMTSIGLDEVITLTMVSEGEIALVNPPDPDLKWLRSKIYPGLVTYVNHLRNLKQTGLRIFEIGNTFTGTSNKYQEHLILSIVIIGQDKELSGILQALGILLGVKDISKLAIVGIQDNVIWSEINLNKAMLQGLKPVNPYSIVSQYPSISEAITVIKPDKYEVLVEKIKKISSLIKEINLLDDTYPGKLTLRIVYHDDKRQLSTEDILPIRKKLETLAG